MIEIPLTQGKVALIDDEDRALVARHKWHAHCNKVDGRWDVRTNVCTASGKRRTLLLHQFLCGFVNADHINRDTFDNRRQNLRPGTTLIQNANRPPIRGRKYKGAFWHKARRHWTSSIAGRWLGAFATEEAAARAYDRAASEAWGEYAYLNFPTTTV